MTNDSNSGLDDSIDSQRLTDEQLKVAEVLGNLIAAKYQRPPLPQNSNLEKRRTSRVHDRPHSPPA